MKGERLIWIQKLTDKDGGLNDLGVLVNLPVLYNILLASVSVNFDRLRAIVRTCYQSHFIPVFYHNTKLFQVLIFQDWQIKPSHKDPFPDL